MSKTCLKCNYTRQPTDTASILQCPGCGAYYSKVAAAHKAGKLTTQATTATPPVQREKQQPPSAKPETQKQTTEAGTATKTENTKLTTCKTCAGTVSKTAETCPHCGEKLTQNKPKADKTKPDAVETKKKDPGCLTLILTFVFVGWMINQFSVDESAPSASTTKTTVSAPPTRQQIIERGFSAWNGSHRGLERYIKKHMNDPDSYEHIETRFIDKDTHLIVITKFRGKNKFGGIVINNVIAKVDIEGSVLEVISQN